MLIPFHRVPVWTGGFSRSKGGNPKSDGSGKNLTSAQSFNDEEAADLSPKKARKVSVAEVVTKILYNPNRKEKQKANTSRVTFANPSLNDEGEGLDLGEVELEDTDQGGQAAPSQQSRGGARVQGTEQQIFQLSRSALLSIVSEVFAFYCRVPEGFPAGTSPARRVSVHLARKVSLAAEDSCTPTKIVLDSGSVHVSFKSNTVAL